MTDNYKPIKSMKEVPEQLRKLRRESIRYPQAELIYRLSHKKLLELASDAGAIYRFDSTVLINRDIFDAYLDVYKRQEIIIADEPTGNVDPEMSHDIIQLLSEIDVYKRQQIGRTPAFSSAAIF